MKLKHNKLRNPALLFELLVRQITTDTLNDKDSKAVNIIKKYYSTNNNSDLARQHKLYYDLVSTKGISEQKADILISAAVEAQRKLNKNNIRKQLYNLVSEIKESYDIEEFFKSKVDNYKTLASIYMLFEMDQAENIDAKKYSSYKYTILESISGKVVAEKKDEMLEEFTSFDKGTRALVYKIMVKKFNEKYNDLDSSQKNLLKEYINNISTTEKLKEYVNTELVKVKKELRKFIPTLPDEARKIKLREMMNTITEIPENKNVGEKDIYNILSCYELIKEFNEIGK